VVFVGRAELVAGKAKVGGSSIGALFLALGVIKMLKGDDWVVWIILGVLFGGLGFFSGKAKGPDQS
jgi:hypothetical protein